ncbi:hypothetical protein CBR_g31091 [Chara braunii]|uniref:Integrase catalytic domain-containing protein n=1 Tax=Chara braunii TaxID=69332 RepID=A0A388LEA2_CHABU|nr:hypothetical protein CBR_g31091 [Chara braunii]|eukprot:GBG80631.1 hypothetical protein CBR_g31091 [Chara braunii]
MEKAGAGGGGLGLVMGVEESIVVNKGHVGFVGEGGCKVFVAYLFDVGDKRKVGNDGGGEVVAEGADILDEAVHGTGLAELAELFKVVINGFLRAEGGSEKVGPLEEGVTWSSGGSAVADFNNPPFSDIAEEAGGGNGEPVGKGIGPMLGEDGVDAVAEATIADEVEADAAAATVEAASTAARWEVLVWRGGMWRFRVRETTPGSGEAPTGSEEAPTGRAEPQGCYTDTSYPSTGLKQAPPRPDAGESNNAASTRQLDQRVDHVLVMLNNISTFATPTSFSEQLDTLKKKVQQLHQLPDNDGSTSASRQYRMPTFLIEKFDDYTHQDLVPWCQGFSTELRIHQVPDHLYISTLFLNAKGGCQIWLNHMATIHDVRVSDLHKKISWDEMTREWKWWFIVDDTPTLAINRLFSMTQGNTPTRDWLTGWQKIVATPDLDLPFSHLRREFYNRSCAALSLVLGDRDQYTTFRRNHRQGARDHQDQPGCCTREISMAASLCGERKFGPRPQPVAAVQPDNLVEDPTSTPASREGDQLVVVQPRSNYNSRRKGKYHDSRIAGHFGANRTIARLRQQFRWPHVIPDVTRYCDSCEVCRRSKSRNRNPYGELRPLPILREPDTSIAMDVTDPFPRDRFEHDGILTVVDRLSKFARFLPCKYYTTAPELARLLHTYWICSHGAPEDILSDGNTRFMSTFWMKESGTEMKPSLARHLQTDGQTERAHQTAQMMLRTLIRPDQKDWVDPDIEFAYNTSLHPAIGMTPFELHHGGRKGRIFADLLLPRTVDIDAACSPASVRKYRELLTQARANVHKAQVRMRQQANRHRVPCPIRAGDLVWVSAEEFAVEQDVSRKLLPKWFGPWTALSAAGDKPDGPSFVIDIPPHLPVHPVFHASKLATYTSAKSDDFPGRRSQDPPSMDGHQEVNRVITDCKYSNKPRQYKIVNRLESLESVLSENWPRPNASHIPGYRYMCFDRGTKVVQSSPTGKITTLSKDSLRLLNQVRAEIDGKRLTAERSRRANTGGKQGTLGDVELCVRGTNNCWVVMRREGERELYVVMEKAGETLALTSEAIDQLSNRFFDGVFTVD